MLAVVVILAALSLSVGYVAIVWYLAGNTAAFIASYAGFFFTHILFGEMETRYGMFKQMKATGGKKWQIILYYFFLIYNLVVVGGCGLFLFLDEPWQFPWEGSAGEIVCSVIALILWLNLGIFLLNKQNFRTQGVNQHYENYGFQRVTRHAGFLLLFGLYAIYGIQNLIRGDSFDDIGVLLSIGMLIYIPIGTACQERRFRLDDDKREMLERTYLFNIWDIKKAVQEQYSVLSSIVWVRTIVFATTFWVLGYKCFTGIFVIAVCGMVIPIFTPWGLHLDAERYLKWMKENKIQTYKEVFEEEKSVKVVVDVVVVDKPTENGLTEENSDRHC